MFIFLFYRQWKLISLLSQLDTGFNHGYYSKVINMLFMRLWNDLHLISPYRITAESNMTVSINLNLQHLPLSNPWAFKVLKIDSFKFQPPFPGKNYLEMPYPSTIFESNESSVWRRVELNKRNNHWQKKTNSPRWFRVWRVLHPAICFLDWRVAV